MLHLLSEWSFQKTISKLKKGAVTMRLVFNVLVLVTLVIGLTPATAKRTTLAAPSACDLQSCYTKCVKLGYLGGTCGSITRSCVCYSYPPPPNQQQ
jgi:hypothetical protein